MLFVFSPQPGPVLPQQLLQYSTDGSATHPRSSTYLALHERLPLGRSLGGQRVFHRRRARRQLGKPDVVPVVRAVAVLGHASGRAAYCADAKSLTGLSGAAELNDAEGYISVYSVALPARGAGHA